LSAQRAGSVESYLIAQGISTSRISINGYGESDPVADNATDAGRQLNRRVEVVIVANDALKESAKKGSLN
jgi:outer membrane protein OmpA-like peptidoglycan-associated protein